MKKLLTVVLLSLTFTGCVHEKLVKIKKTEVEKIDFANRQIKLSGDTLSYDSLSIVIYPDRSNVEFYGKEKGRPVIYSIENRENVSAIAQFKTYIQRVKDVL